MSSEQIVKCTLNGDMRRFGLKSPYTFSNLYKSLSQIYTPLVAHHFTIRYTDDEGDKISITSDSELLEAIRIAHNQPAKLLRLELSVAAGELLLPLEGESPKEVESPKAPAVAEPEELLAKIQQANKALSSPFPSLSGLAVQIPGTWKNEAELSGDTPTPLPVEEEPSPKKKIADELNELSDVTLGEILRLAKVASDELKATPVSFNVKKDTSDTVSEFFDHLKKLSAATCEESISKGEKISRSLEKTHFEIPQVEVGALESSNLHFARETASDMRKIAEETSLKLGAI